MCAASSSFHTPGINSAYQSWKVQLENNPEKARIQLGSIDPAEAVAIIKALAREIKHGGNKELGFKALPMISNTDSKHLSKQKEKLFRVMRERNLFRNNDEKNRDLFNAALRRKDEKLMNWLLRTVIDLYQRDMMGSNVIHEICERGTPEMICDAVKICLKSHKKPENRTKENPLLALSSRNSALLQNRVFSGRPVSPLRILPYRQDFCEIVKAIKKEKLEIIVSDLIYETRCVDDDVIFIDKSVWYRNAGTTHPYPLYEVFALVALNPKKTELKLTFEKLYENLNFACKRNDRIIVDMILEGWFLNHNTLSKEGLKFYKQGVVWASNNNHFTLFATLLTHDRFLGCTNFPPPPLKRTYQVLQNCTGHQAHVNIKKILDHLPPNKVIDANGNSAIIHAVQCKDFLFLDLACMNEHQLKHINKPNKKGETPLSIALKENFIEGVEGLIRHGAVPADESEWVDILDLLMEKGSPFSVQYILVKFPNASVRPLKNAHLLFENAISSPNSDFLDIVEVFLNSTYYQNYEKEHLGDLVFVAKFPQLLKLAIENHKFKLADRLAPNILRSQTMAEFFFEFLCNQIEVKNYLGVKYILGKEKNIRLVDANDKSLLHYASETGDLEIFKKVLRASAPGALNKPDRWGKTPLLSAVLGGHHEIVPIFYRKGQRLKHDQIRRVMKSIGSKFNAETLFFLMTQHAKYFKSLTAYHSYIFSMALKSKSIHREMLKRVLEYGYVPALKNDKAELFLQALVLNGEVELLERMLTHPGVFLGDRTPLLNQVLMAACAGSHSDVVRVLLTHTPNFSEGNPMLGALLLTTALQNRTFGREEIIKLLCGHGVNLNKRLSIRTPDGEVEDLTPLTYEAGYGSIEGLRLLLQLGAQVKQERVGLVESPYEKALIEWKFDNALFLKENGADTQLLLVQVSTTPDELVIIASALGSKDLIEVALSAGGNLYIADDQFNTPLHYAAKYGYLEAMTFLLNAIPSSLNAPNDREQTPAHLAALRGQHEAIKLLENAGADMSSPDFTGHTPEQHLLNWEYPVNRDILKEAGAAPFSIPKAPKKATLLPLFEIAKRMSGKGGWHWKRIEYISKMIKKRSNNLSVSQDPKEKKIWYAQLDNNLRYLGHLLASASPERQEAAIRDIAKESEMCGTAWITEVKQQITPPDKLIESNSPDIQIYTILQSYKLWVISQLQQKYESLPEQVEMGMGRHIQMYLEKHLSPLLGFQGIDKRIKDTLEPTVLLQKNLLNDFLELYTYTHIHEWLKEEIPARMKAPQIYALFGGFLSEWVDNHKETVASCMRRETSDLEQELNNDFDWIANNLFYPQGEKYVLNDWGIMMLLLATGVIQHRTV